LLNYRRRPVDNVEAILDGRQPVELAAARLKRVPDLLVS